MNQVYWTPAAWMAAGTLAAFTEPVGVVLPVGLPTGAGRLPYVTAGASRGSTLGPSPTAFFTCDYRRGDRGDGSNGGGSNDGGGPPRLVLRTT
jgi:hypothetical protein